MAATAPLSPPLPAASDPQACAADLARLTALARCTPGDLAALAERTTAREVARGTVLFARGDACDEVYGLARGVVTLVRDAAPAPRDVLDLLTPGALFGEQALLRGTPHAHSALAAARCRVLVIPARALADLLRTRAALASALLAHLGARVDALLERCARVGAYSAEQRVAALLLEHADAHGLLRAEFGAASRRALSGYLRLRPETLSRVISRFRRRGWLCDAGPAGQRVDRPALAAQLPPAG